MLLFPFEKKYFEKENIPSTFTGHPLLENEKKAKIDISQIIKDHKKIISIFPGSRQSELDIHLPILIDFIKMMNKKYNDIFYVCLLYTSPSPRDLSTSRMPSSA